MTAPRRHLPTPPSPPRRIRRLISGARRDSDARADAGPPPRSGTLADPAPTLASPAPARYLARTGHGRGPRLSGHGRAAAFGPAARGLSLRELASRLGVSPASSLRSRRAGPTHPSAACTRWPANWTCRSTSCVHRQPARRAGVGVRRPRGSRDKGIVFARTAGRNPAGDPARFGVMWDRLTTVSSNRASSSST